ncbi:hypothetical protein GobsT_60660 [Gemmata obscuriglobus]|nr:hypothetical protein GobsT_60660 [Gemmata obscuriglobus]VTS10583.1 unnamed protein product [Gemmata obscuriglobus UQM 2246]
MNRITPTNPSATGSPSANCYKNFEIAPPRFPRMRTPWWARVDEVGAARTRQGQ